MFDRMQPEQRKEALAEYKRILDGDTDAKPLRRLRAQ